MGPSGACISRDGSHRAWIAEVCTSISIVYMYVCIYVLCMYVCMYVCIYVCMSVYLIFETSYDRSLDIKGNDQSTRKAKMQRSMASTFVPTFGSCGLRVAATTTTSAAARRATATQRRQRDARQATTTTTTTTTSNSCESVCKAIVFAHLGSDGAVAVRSAHKAFGRTKNSLSQQSRRVFGCK